MSERKNRIFSALSLVLYTFMVFSFIVPYCASAETKASVSLNCAEGSVKVSDMKWRIYRVGERSGDSYKLTSSYSAYPIDMKHLDKSNVTGTAQALESFIVGDGLSADAEGITDMNGTVVFDDLGLGLYLAVADKVRKEPLVYTAAPLLFEIKEGNSEEEAFPKVYSTITLSGESVSYTVKKVWADSNNAYRARPDDVNVELYKDGVLNDTVVLNEKNKWQYSWDSSDTGAEWRVVERNIPKKYALQIERNSYQYLIKNTYTTDLIIGGGEDIFTTTSYLTTEAGRTATTAVSSAVTSVTSKSTGTDLPQTGQLWYPIIPLAGGGIILIIVGMLIGKKKDDER